MSYDAYSSKRSASGMTFVRLLFIILLLAGIGVPGLKVVPTLVEYRAITNSLDSIKAAGGSQRAMRAAFDRNASVNDISAISGQDLTIENGSNDAPELSFAYSKKISIYGPVSLLLDYHGTTAKP